MLKSSLPLLLSNKFGAGERHSSQMKMDHGGLLALTDGSFKCCSCDYTAKSGLPAWYQKQELLSFGTRKNLEHTRKNLRRSPRTVERAARTQRGEDMFVEAWHRDC